MQKLTETRTLFHLESKLARKSNNYSELKLAFFPKITQQ